MQVDVFDRVEALPQHAIDRMSYRNEQPFFVSHDWFACLAHHGLDDVMRPRVYLAHDDTGAQCALYCATTVKRRLVSLSNFYTMEYSPVMAGANADVGLRAIVETIAREKWNTIDLRVMREEYGTYEQLQALFAEQGFHVFPYHQYANWHLDVDQRGFEEYFKGLSSRLRNTVRRKGNKLKRDHELSIGLYPRDDLSLADALEIYETVYQSSWKQAEPFPDFMPALFRLCDELGIVRVGVARIDDEPAAAQIWINDLGRTLIYKLAYDEKYAPMSIGSVLSRELFEHAIDVDRVNEIDYGVGDENYKRDWMSGVRQLGGMLACNKSTLGGTMVAAREKLAQLTRGLRKGAQPKD